MSNWRTALLDLLKENDEPGVNFPQEMLRNQSTALSVFLAEKVIPAFEEFKAELDKYDRIVSIFRDKNSITIDIHHDGNLELTYSIVLITKLGQLHPRVDIRYLEKSTPVHESIARPYGDLDPDTMLDVIGKDQILNHLVSTYIKHSGDQ